MEYVEQNDQRDQYENCEQNPQPKQGCRLTDQCEGCECKGVVCNSLGPTCEFHVLNRACGIARAGEECAVEQLHGQECRGLDLVGDRGILGQNECVGQRLGSVCIYRGGNQRADVGNACKILAILHIEEELNRTTVGLCLSCNTVDGVGKGLGCVGHVDVNRACGHGECAVGQRYGIAVCILHRNGCGVSDLILCGDSDGRTCNCGVGRNGYVRSCNDRISHIGVNRVDGYNVISADGLISNIPATDLVCHCGNCGNNILGVVVLHGDTRDGADGGAVCNKLDGVGDQIPLCEEVQILHAKLGGEACPLTALKVSRRSEVGNCLGKCLGQTALDGVDFGCRVGNGQTFVQRTVYVEVNVIGLARQGDGHLNVLANHCEGVAIVVGVGAVNDTVLYDLIACGNCKVEYHVCTCGIVLNDLFTDLRTCLLQGVGDGILGCYHELGEVLCVEGNKLTVSRNRTLYRLLCAGGIKGVDLGSGIGKLCEGNLNGNRLGSKVGGSRTVKQDLEIVGCNAACIAVKLAKSGICKICGLVCKGCYVLGVVSKVSKRLILERYEREVLRIVLNCNVKTNVGLCRRTGQNVGISTFGASKVDNEALGKLAQNRQRVNAVLLGDLVCKACIREAQIVNRSQRELERGILGDLGGGNVNRFLTHQPTDGVRTVEVGIGGLGGVNQRLDLCQLLGIICQSCAVVYHEVTQHVVLFVNEDHFVHMQVCVDSHIVIGHGLELDTVLSRPTHELITCKRGIVLVNVQIGSNGQERSEKHRALVTRHELDLADILHSHRKAYVQCNVVACQTADDQINNLFGCGNVHLGEYAIDYFFNDRLGIVGKVACFCKHAVSVVQIHKACVLQLNGEQIKLGNQEVLYLNILILIFGCLVDCLIVQLVKGVGVENVESVDTNLACNDLCNLFDHRNVLAAVENFLYGNIAHIDSELALDSREQLLNSCDLLCLIHITVCLYGQGLEICVYVASRTCLDCGTYAFDRLIRGFIKDILNHFVQILLGIIRTQLGIQLFEANLQNALCLESFVQRGRLDRAENCDHVLKRELLVKQIDHTVQACGGHRHDLLAKFGGQRIEIKKLCVNSSDLGGHREIDHDRLGRNLEGVGINIIIKKSFELGSRIANDVQVSCKNELEFDLLGLFGVGAVYGVAQLYRRGEDHVVFKRYKIIKLGNQVLKHHDQLLGMDLKQRVACSLRRNGVVVDLDEIDVRKNLIYNECGKVNCHTLDVGFFQNFLCDVNKFFII